MAVYLYLSVVRLLCRQCDEDQLSPCTAIGREDPREPASALLQGAITQLYPAYPYSSGRTFTMKRWSVLGRLLQMLLQELFAAERLIHTRKHARVSLADAAPRLARSRRLDRTPHRRRIGHALKSFASAAAKPSGYRKIDRSQK